MAPALTGAATQAIKLPETSTPASSDSVTSRRRISDQVLKKKQTRVPLDNSTNCATRNETADVSPVSHLNGNSLRSVDKQFGVCPTRQGVVRLNSEQSQNLLTQEPILTLTKALVSKYLRNNTPGSKIMNRPSNALDKDLGQNQGRSAKNRHQSSGGGSGSGQMHADDQHGTNGRSLHSSYNSGNMGPRENKSASQTSSNMSSKSFGKNFEQSKSTEGFSISSNPHSLDSSWDEHRIEQSVSDQCTEVSKKHAQLERRLDFLIRRLSRTQARQVQQHIQQELNNYTGFQQQHLHTVTKSPAKFGQGSPNSADLKKELFSDGVKHMSTAALVSLVQKIQKTSPFPVSHQPVLPELTSVLNMSSDVRKDSQVVADKLQMNLHAVQSVLDSDATESSSGGESDGGEDVSRDVKWPLPSTSLARRAEWKWAAERAAIASKWTWLQAQVSDLEYRIRQQTELYRQARSSKGPVVLADHLTTSQTVSLATTSRPDHPVFTGPAPPQGVCYSQLPGNQPMTAAGGVQFPHCKSLSRHDTLSQRLTDPSHVGKTETSTLNGMSTDPYFQTTDLVQDPTCRAARCLPLKHPLRKRKLLRTREICLKSVKAAKLSTVKCQCHHSVTPCILCCQRGEIQAVDPHHMAFQERVALMDHSYHQVLSFNEEVPLSVHFEGLLRSGECQNNPTIQRPRPEQSQRVHKVAKPPIFTEARKSLLRKSATSIMIQSAKIRNKYENKVARKSVPSQDKPLGKRALSAELNSIKVKHPPFSIGRGRGRRKFRGGRGGYMRKNAPMSAFLDGSGAPREREVRRRRGQTTFDINSIVIPRSMAALTRVEKLEYKEIPVPCWRQLAENAAKEAEEREKEELVHSKSNGLIATEPATEEVEDLSDEAYIHRHDICEAAEKKRFSTAVRAPHWRRRARAVLNHHTQGSTPLHSTPAAAVSMATQASLDGSQFGDEEWEGESPGLDLSFPHSPAPYGALSDRMSAFGDAVNTNAQPDPGALSRHEPSDHVSLLRSERSNSFTRGERSTSVKFSRSEHSGVNPSGSELLDNVPRTERSNSVSLSHGDGVSLSRTVSVDSQGDGVPDQDSSVKAWLPRQFPLTDEEVNELEKENTTDCNELGLTLRIKTLRPQPVETGSQAGSSVCGSLPPSPLPSSSSTSAAGDWDAGDCDWPPESEKKYVKRTKGIKR